MNKTAIDLTWVRHQKVGGTESFVRNLLDGIASVATAEQKFVLLLAKDNADSFEKYRNMPCFAIEICQTVSENQKKKGHLAEHPDGEATAKRRNHRLFGADLRHAVFRHPGHKVCHGNS